MVVKSPRVFIYLTVPVYNDDRLCVVTSRTLPSSLHVELQHRRREWRHIPVEWPRATGEAGGSWVHGSLVIEEVVVVQVSRCLHSYVSSHVRDPTLGVGTSSYQYRAVDAGVRGVDIDAQGDDMISRIDDLFQLLGVWTPA